MKKFLAVMATLTTGWVLGLASVVWTSDRIAEKPELGKGEIYEDDDITVTAITSKDNDVALAAVKFKK